MELMVGTYSKEKAQVRLEGEIDHSQSDTIFGYLQPFLQNEIRMLTLDFSGVKYLDSGAVNMVLQTQRILQEKGSVLEIIGPNPWVRKILRITGAEGLIKFQVSAMQPEYVAEKRLVPFSEKNFLITAEIHQIRRIRSELKQALEDIGLGEIECMDVLVAVSEAINNAMEHSAALRHEHMVSVNLKYEKGYLQVDVLDRGNGFDRCELSMKTTDQHSLRGRGVLLMEALSSKVEYNFLEDGFLVSLYFKC